MNPDEPTEIGGEVINNDQSPEAQMQVDEAPAGEAPMMIDEAPVSEPMVSVAPAEAPPMELAPPAVVASTTPVPEPEVPAVVTEIAQDRAARSRARRAARTSTSNTASAVAAPTPSVAYQSTHTSPTAVAAAVPPAAMSQAEQDTMIKNRARRGYTEGPAVVPGAISAAHHAGPAVMEVTTEAAPTAQVGGLDELVRKRETRAAARQARRGGQSSEVVAAPAPKAGAFANVSEDERQRRFDAKMAQMDQKHEDSREKHQSSGTTTVSGIVEPTPVVDPSQPATTTRANFSQMNEEERQRRYDAKMAQIGQGHEDSKEKRSSAEGGPLNAPRPQSSGVNSKLDIMNEKSASSSHFSRPLVPSNHSHVTTTADRGIAVAPDVEYGSYSQPQGHDGELAVAVAIDEDEEDDKDIVYAIEYDPDSKPPIYQNRRFRFIALLCTVLVGLIIIAIAIAVPVSNGKKSTVILTLAPTASPSAAPTSTREVQFFGKIVPKVNDTSSLLGATWSELLSSPGTPQYLAVQWMMNEDPMRMEPSDDWFFQRFMMVFLWYQTTDNGQKPWRSCNPPEGDAPDKELCTLYEFTRNPDDSISYDPKQRKIRWLSGQGVCKWEGVECGGGSKVVGITLFGQDLTGTLPPELASLDFLQKISFAYNAMTGTIPAEWAEAEHLRDIEVHGNLLTGTIPETFFEEDKLENLVNLNVGDNLFSGALDTRIGLMRDLKGIHIFENNFNGPIPTEIGNLRSLSFTRINGNEFSGPIPTELGRLKQLIELWYHECDFTGNIPSQLGNFRRLTDMRLWGNKLTGSIPEELYNLSSLTRISVRDMALTGTISPKVGEMAKLIQFKVSNNKLTGPIPSELEQLPWLRLAWLHLNQFTGSVPTNICNLVKPNGLNFFQADCHPIENPPNECICCSACCDRDSGVCLSTNI